VIGVQGRPSPTTPNGHRLSRIGTISAFMRSS
jgi:hypothetical protein